MGSVQNLKCSDFTTGPNACWRINPSRFYGTGFLAFSDSGSLRLVCPCLICDRQSTSHPRGPDLVCPSRVMTCLSTESLLGPWLRLKGVGRPEGTRAMKSTPSRLLNSKSLIASPTYHLVCVFTCLDQSVFRSESAMDVILLGRRCLELLVNESRASSSIYVENPSPRPR